MKRIIIATTVAAAVFWSFRRWLDHRYVKLRLSTHRPTETWENEGGSLAPDPTGFETSRAPR
jgi:hypothetical protein